MAVSEPARLKDKLGIVVEKLAAIPDSAPNGFAYLMACFAVERVNLAIKSEVVA